MMTLRSYLLQRISAIIMVPLVITHLIVIVYAIRGGLTAEEILGRTQGNYYWALFYGLFVTTAGVHAAIGIRTILFEWSGLKRPWLNVISWLVAASLIILGLRAVIAVTLP